MSNAELNNNNAGISRKILNIDEFDIFVKNNSIDIIEISNSTFSEKVELLSHYENIITFSGANTINLLIAYNFKNIIICTHKYFIIESIKHIIDANIYFSIGDTEKYNNIKHANMEYYIDIKNVKHIMDQIY